MAMRILWPNLPDQFVPVARDAIGAGFETDFCANATEVTDEQWANADAVVGSCPAQYIDKQRKCRIFVKYGVGYDDVEFASVLAVPLTSIRQPKYELGRAAAELLLDEANNPATHQHKHVMYQPELIVRESSRM